MHSHDRPAAAFVGSNGFTAPQAHLSGVRRPRRPARREEDSILPNRVCNSAALARFARPKGRFRLALTAFAMALGLSACQMVGPGNGALVPSSNPVTVDTVTRGNRLVGMAREQHPRILATYGGEYSDRKLELMVARVVGRLTQGSDTPDLAYRVTILDSPSVNAFALPGGFLYVTRGLLALANDSAELAAVLAHEMAHVRANHGLERQKKEAEEKLASQVVNEVLGGSAAARAALVRGKLRLAQFSRNQELEADKIGIKAIARSGYDPYAAARFLQSMAAYQAFRSVDSAHDASLDFLATHPNAPQRIQLARQEAAKYGPPGTGVRDRDKFLAGIDGMMYGDKPEEGYVRGNRFLHPGLGIAFSVPEGFVIDNSAAAVTAAGPGDVAVRFDGATVSQSDSLPEYLTSGWVTGLDRDTIRSTSINGKEAATARAQADGWKFDVTVIRSGEQVYRLLTAAPLSSDALQSTARFVSQSFHVLSAREKAALSPLRIRVATVQAGQNTASLARRMVGVNRKVALFRLLNVLGPGETPSVGDRVKIVTDR